MNSFRWIDRLLSRIEFGRKTKLLILVIALGMGSIVFVLFISIFAIKYDYDTLYQKRTLPLVHLQEIKDLYAVNIKDTLHQLHQHSISSNEATEVIESARKVIRKQWKEYQDTTRRRIHGIAGFAHRWLDIFFPLNAPKKSENYQNGLILRIENKMKTIDNQLTRLFHPKKVNNNVESDRSLNNAIAMEIDSLNIYLSSLLNFQLKKAIQEKQRNDRTFGLSIAMLSLLIGLIILLILSVSFFLLNNFRQLHRQLESKVEEKTKALRELNESLEKRIQCEVIASRKKDRIMFQQARLASMGEMLQNIAHQWRQPLGALTMIIQSFQTKSLQGKLTQEYIDCQVEQAMRLAESMSQTLEDFRTFFRPDKVHKIFRLRNAVEKALELTSFQLEREGIMVELFEKENPEIFGYENELIHVLLNLINNARESLIDSHKSDKRIRIIVKRSGSRNLIHVIDNGGGIDDAILPKIFEPYFTTKHKRVGTGIGLYMCRQMVEKHMGGKITAKNIRYKFSEKGGLEAGALFIVEIPNKQPFSGKEVPL